MNESLIICDVILRPGFVRHRHLERTKTFVLGFVFVFVLAHWLLVHPRAARTFTLRHLNKQHKKLCLVAIPACNRSSNSRRLRPWCSQPRTSTEGSGWFCQIRSHLKIRQLNFLGILTSMTLSCGSQVRCKPYTTLQSMMNAKLSRQWF